MADQLTQASSSSASSFGYSNFEVFLNFRGEDTRKNFTGFLHKALKDNGINDFIDSEKLWVGEDIGPALLRAIEGSKISIPVFSEGYGSSKWCLIELSHMLRCHTSNGQMVLPIFLDVEPSDVRNQTGSFEGSFQEHEKKFEPHVLESWREALRMIGNLKGWVLKEDTNGNQAELVELVVKRVLSELISSTHLTVCEYPIGIDSHVNDLVSLLNISSNDVQFVGICGFGGIGKTTIAKALYNRIFPNFKRQSFLSDIREQAKQCMGLATLQKRLLKDIFKADFDIANDHRGKTLIKERLCKENVLLVLDDVDDKEQLSALAGELNWFGQGSTVIITTRDENILNKATVNGDKIYRPQILDHMQSLQLFSLHAFSRDQPPEDYMQLSHDVACYSGGLPLTLEVLGSYLSDKSNTKVWESTLQKLKEIPHEKVQRRLKISYDNLDNYQKAIFLDAACFFIGWQKEIVNSIWEACGYHPESAIYTLIKRSLLKFEGNYLKMHDQIRDMGRTIVLEENPIEPGKRSRLWFHEDILEVLEGYKGTDMIRGLKLPSTLQSIDLYTEHFEMMHNLRYLDIDHKNYMGDLSHLPFGLKYFRWVSCPEGTILRTNFYHRRMVYLNLSESQMKNAWNIGPQDENKLFQKLKHLDLSHCTYLSESPNFSWFPCLEQLDLGHCYFLDKLDDSIGQLSSLKQLSLRHCFLLKKLPKSIGDLKSLVKLDLRGINKMKKLPDISRLSFLKELLLDGCISLNLPESIGDLKSLVELRLSGVTIIEELPDGVGLLEKLELLDANRCFKLVKLPRSMGRMKCLRSIMLKKTAIAKLPDDFLMLSEIQELKMPMNIQSLPADLSPLNNLKELDFSNGICLKYLPVLPSSLVVLCCDECYLLEQLPDLSRQKKLTTLRLKDCRKLREIRGLEGTESLKELDAQGCYNLTYSPRRRHGQGTIRRYRSPSERFSLTANDGIYNKGLIICIVFEFPSYILAFWQRERVSALALNFDISACIHQKNKTIRCLHSLEFEDVKMTANGQLICVHHFEGFNWFGIPLQGKADIEGIRVSKILDFPYCSPNSTVNLVEILFEKR